MCYPYLFRSSLRFFACVLYIFAERDDDTHAAVPGRHRLPEDAHPRALFFERVFDASVRRILGRSVGKYRHRSARPTRYFWDREPEDGAHVELHLTHVLARHRHHAGVMRTRAKLGEPDLTGFHKKLDTEN